MAATETAREKALVNYRKKLLEHRELDARLKESMSNMLLLILKDAEGTKMYDTLIHFLLCVSFVGLFVPFVSFIEEKKICGLQSLK